MYELSEPKRAAKYTHHPQDCTGNVHHGFCGGGARIVGIENWGNSCESIRRKTSILILFDGEVN